MDWDLQAEACWQGSATQLWTVPDAPLLCPAPVPNSTAFRSPAVASCFERCWWLQSKCWHIKEVTNTSPSSPSSWDTFLSLSWWPVHDRGHESVSRCIKNRLSKQDEGFRCVPYPVHNTLYFSIYLLIVKFLAGISIPQNFLYLFDALCLPDCSDTPE